MKNITILIVLTLFIYSCQNKSEYSADAQSLEITQAWMRPGVENRNTAAFMTIINNTKDNDTLFSASSDIAKVVELHETFTRENDLKGMRHVDFIPIPANSSVKLKPGSFHVMLIGLNSDLKKGDNKKIDLLFKRNNSISISLEVK